MANRTIRYLFFTLTVAALALVAGCSLVQSGPTARLEVKPVVLYAGDKAAFDAAPSYGPQAIVSYHWTFGDGEETDGKQVEHTFATYGTYTISLRVTDIDGAVATTEKQIVVYAQSGSIVFQDQFSDGDAALERWVLDPNWASAGEGTIDNVGGGYGYALHIHSGVDRWQRRSVSVSLPPLRVGQRLVFTCKVMMTKTQDLQNLAIFPARKDLSSATPLVPYYLYTNIGGGAQIHEPDAHGTDIRHPLAFAPGVYLWYTYEFVFSRTGYEFYINDDLYASGDSGSSLADGGDWLIMVGDESHQEACNAYFDDFDLRVEE